MKKRFTFLGVSLLLFGYMLNKEIEKAGEQAALRHIFRFRSRGRDQYLST